MITPRGNVGYLTDLGAHLFPNRSALLQPGLQLSYREVDDRAGQIARLLSTVGVTVGDRVLVLFENDIRFIETIFGTMRLGAVPVPCNVRLGPEALLEISRDSGAVALIASPKMIDTALFLSERATYRAIIAIDGIGHGIIDYETALRAGPSESTSTDVDVAVDTVCLQPYTSGSTGRPKGVLLTHGGLLHNANAMRAVCLLKPDDRACVSAPLFHANALSAVLPCIMAGASVVVLPQFDPAALIESLSTYRCTYTVGVPAMFASMLSETAALARGDFTSVRFLACGSAPVSAALLVRLEEALPGVTIVEGYGLTEGGPVVSCSPVWGIRKHGSAGLPLPDVRTRVVRSDGTDAGVNEIGELWVNSPGNALGYHNLPNATTDRFVDGWLRTGDQMRQDADGYLYFIGRVDDMINVGGENVFPAEVENLLMTHPAVRNACVVPMFHDIKGEVPVAFIVLADTPRVSEQELKDFCTSKGPSYAHPRRIVVLESLPVTGSGKVDRSLLRRQADLLTRH